MNVDIHVKSIWLSFTNHSGLLIPRTFLNPSNEAYEFTRTFQLENYNSPFLELFAMPITLEPAIIY